MPKKSENKLENVFVSELFFQHFLSQVTGNPLIERIRAVQPIAKGRGYSRVLDTVTEAEWNEIYELAVHARGQMSGADRETVLRAAICAKAMATRMEKAGVDNPQPFKATRTRTRKTKVAATPAPVAPIVSNTVDALNTIAADTTEDTTEDTDLSSHVVVPVVPATLVTAEDVEAASDAELDQFETDISYG